MRSRLTVPCALSLPLLSILSGCAGDAVVPTVRALERAGRVAFVCLGAPGANSAARPMGECSGEKADGVDDFGTDGSLPHVYALVTLETRGEVAVVDVTSRDENVLDLDPNTPGATHVPVGAQPVDIVSTSGGMAAFVATAETGSPRLWALPTDLLRPCSVDPDRCDDSPIVLSSLKGCRLSSAPGSMVLAYDSPNADGLVRESCGTSPREPSGDPSSLESEGFGRAKLLVTLPQEGRVVLVDAQSVLDGSASADAECQIEEIELDLRSEVPPAQFTVQNSGEPGCFLPPEVVVPGEKPSSPKPFSMSLADNVLAVSDLNAPLIYVLDVEDVCLPLSLPTLHATSNEDPTRRVKLGKVTVGPRSSAGRRFVYAVDVEDKSVVPFELSKGIEPIQRAAASSNPFQPQDRIRFAAAPEDVRLVVRDTPESSGSFVAPFGTLCDPDPEARRCTGGDEPCDLGTLYRTSSDFETGAGPLTLRGQFAVVALASGEISVIDVDDFDAPCRGPSEPQSDFGCEVPSTTEDLKSSDEVSCRVVEAHTPRAATYFMSNDEVGRHEPGLQSFPILSLADGTVLSDSIVMRALKPTVTTSALRLAVGGDVLEVDDQTLAVSDEQGPRNTLTMNLEDPRAHQIDETWTLTFRGVLPGTDVRVGSFQQDGRVTDPIGGFCELGVQSEALTLELELANGVSEEEAAQNAAIFADQFVVTEPLFESGASYWDSSQCSYSDCRATFGEADQPTEERRLRIRRAYEGELHVEPPSDLMRCCFPTAVDYQIRPGAEWLLVGSASGYLHHVAPDESGECRVSCDARKSSLVGRARHRAASDAAEFVARGDRDAFESALFRFAILAFTSPEEDAAFKFTTQGAFLPLRPGLTDSGRAYVQPQSLSYVKELDQFVATDGALEGLLFLPADMAGSVTQYY